MATQRSPMRSPSARRPGHRMGGGLAEHDPLGEPVDLRERPVEDADRVPRRCFETSHPSGSERPFACP